jgi:hypothetical protein
VELPGSIEARLELLERFVYQELPAMVARVVHERAGRLIGERTARILHYRGVYTPSAHGVTAGD